MFSNLVIVCENGENFKNVDIVVDLEDWFLNLQLGNVVVVIQVDVVFGIYSIIIVILFDFIGDSFFDNVDFVGVVKEGDDWIVGWIIGLE